jgi:hypothetical protein
MPSSVTPPTDSSAGVTANMQLAPGVVCRAMFFKEPFAGTTQFRPSVVDVQGKFARSNSRGVANRLPTRPPAQRRMIGSRQVELSHFHDKSDQFFALAMRLSKRRAKSEPFHGEIGIMAPYVRCCSR